MDVVIRVAADLVNLLTPGEDRGRRYVPPEGDERTAAVGTVLRGAGGREANWEEAAELCFVAAELRGVFEAVSTGAVDDAARRSTRCSSAPAPGQNSNGTTVNPGTCTSTPPTTPCRTAAAGCDLMPEPGQDRRVPRPPALRTMGAH